MYLQITMVIANFCREITSPGPINFGAIAYPEFSACNNQYRRDRWRTWLPHWRFSNNQYHPPHLGKGKPSKELLQHKSSPHKPVLYQILTQFWLKCHLLRPNLELELGFRSTCVCNLMVHNECNAHIKQVDEMLSFSRGVLTRSQKVVSCYL